MTDDIRHDPRTVNLVAGFLAREFGDDGFLPFSKRDGAAVRLLDLLAEAFPPMLALAPGQLSDVEMARLHRLWLEAQADSTGGLAILPPNASDLWRRYTPEQRRAWLTGHRDDAIERGIPGDLVDLMIQDAEADR